MPFDIGKKTLFLILLTALILTGCFFGGHILAQGLYRPASPVDYHGFLKNLETAVWVVFAAIVVICFVVAGILLLTAGGDAEKLQKARSALYWGITGVIVGILAYSILAIIGLALGIS